MSDKIAVAEGLYNFAIFGVNGGVTHRSGQSERPVSEAISLGKGNPTPAPSLGNVNEVCSVGASSCPIIPTAEEITKRYTNLDTIMETQLPSIETSK